MEELANLARTVDFEVVDSILVRQREPESRYLIGSGKTDEIVNRARELEADCIIFDEELSPSQQRNWERLSDLCVIDRHEVILDIFASRASSREAHLQVELARMEYALPRLTRAWTHLSRQRGGARGTRGEGETQLETDRRIVKNRIASVRRELADVRQQRATRRKRRTRERVPAASIIGYTNAGKSSLLNLLSDADVTARNQLFSTLDPTTRRVHLEGGREVLLTDTVGFIRKLPHDLIEAFKSTLEETVLADFLVHVLDASSPEVEEHHATTMQVLRELEIEEKPILTVFNKIDRLEDPLTRTMLEASHPGSVFISVRSGEGLESLREALLRMSSSACSTVDLSIPSNRYDLVALVHRTGTIFTEDYGDGTVRLSASIPPHTRSILSAYIA